MKNFDFRRMHSPSFDPRVFNVSTTEIGRIHCDESDIMQTVNEQLRSVEDVCRGSYE